MEPKFQFISAQSFRKETNQWDSALLMKINCKPLSGKGKYVYFHLKRTKGTKLDDH
jgi:L,D-peptidoglycan transpeptidase YkuD (ErfK/YbiS/YcfS/YnhG family)